jgi:hypothetical protein
VAAVPGDVSPTPLKKMVILIVYHLDSHLQIVFYLSGILLLLSYFQFAAKVMVISLLCLISQQL